jgi:Spy/CpxP family protein refolding chaperone
MIGPIEEISMKRYKTVTSILLAAFLVGAAPMFFAFQQGGGAREGGPVTINPFRSSTGAWWTNAALVARLGLTEDQKTRIARAYENHRLKIASTTNQLEKEELQLVGLLRAESIDRNAVLSQGDRVIQARGEVERVNNAMTLEMREVLTRTQWIQLPQPGRLTFIDPVQNDVGGGRGGPPGQKK